MNMTLEGRAKHLPDIQRNFMWEVYIPAIGLMTGFRANMFDMMIRARSATIPGRTNTAITSEFRGFKQYFPGKNEFSPTFSIQLEETEDRIVWRSMHAWQERIFNTDPKSPLGGSSAGLIKRQLATDIYVVPHTYSGIPMNPIRFYNCFPVAIPDVALTYTGNEAVTFDVTFQYDFWQPTVMMW